MRGLLQDLVIVQAVPVVKSKTGSEDSALLLNVTSHPAAVESNTWGFSFFLFAGQSPCAGLCYESRHLDRCTGRLL